MSAKKLIPLLDRVLIQKVVAPSKSIGGVLLPESAAQKVNQGSVVAVGPGRRTMNGDIIPVSVKEGDKVLLPEFGGIKVNVGESSAPGAEAPEYYLFRDEELLGVLTE